MENKTDTCFRKKNSKVRGLRSAGGGVCILECSVEKLLCKQRLEVESEIWRNRDKSVLDRGRSQCKGPEVVVCLVCSRKSKKIWQEQRK